MIGINSINLISLRQPRKFFDPARIADCIAWYDFTDVQKIFTDVAGTARPSDGAEIKRVEAAERVAVEEGKGRKTREEEKRSEKVNVVVTDSSVDYIVKRVIKITYQGDTFDEEDKITFTHNVVAIP